LKTIAIRQRRISLRSTRPQRKRERKDKKQPRITEENSKVKMKSVKLRNRCAMRFLLQKVTTDNHGFSTNYERTTMNSFATEEKEFLEKEKVLFLIIS
jgi:hypothetical protein